MVAWLVGGALRSFESSDGADAISKPIETSTAAALYRLLDQACIRCEDVLCTTEAGGEKSRSRVAGLSENVCCGVKTP